MAFRPSHGDRIRTSVWPANSAATQPVLVRVASGLPQVSVDLVNVVLLAASWQLRLVTVGSFIEKVLPDWVVLRLTGLGPFKAAVPVPCATCSWVPSTRPS